MATVKMVEYSYPSSTNAVKFGFSNGCYTVETIDRPLGLPCAQKAFLYRIDAIKHALSLDIPWCKHWLKYRKQWLNDNLN